MNCPRQQWLASLAVLFLILSAFNCWAVPQKINYQGKLTDTNGDPIVTPSVQMQFGIYATSSGGATLWSENQTVSVNDGVFNVYLGTAIAFPPNLFSGPRYLGITVEAGTEMTPRHPLISVPYAFTADDADTLDGMDSTAFGDITGVTGGTGLTGGGLSGDVELNADTSYLQRLVSGTCGEDSSIRVVNSDGSVICDPDDTGITTETDPTVLSSVKDGIVWSEIGSRPPGLDDGDDTGLTGTIITDYVPKWDGSTLVTGTIFDDGNVGIGTDSPESLFHLESIGGVDLIIEADSNNMWQDQNARVVLRQGGGGVSSRIGYRHAENDLEIMQEFNDSLIFGTNDTDRLTIDNNGVVQTISSEASGALFELKNTYNPAWGHNKTLGGINFLDYAGTTRGSMHYFHHGALDGGDNSTGLYFSTEGVPRMMVDWDGKVGIGTGKPSTKLQVSGGSDATLGNWSGFVVIGTEDVTNIVMDSNEIMARNNGAPSKLYLNAEGGNVVVKVLEITGGADIAEPFRFVDLKAAQPGMVVAIDPERTGYLRIADRAYDRTVAGIISGANGVNPGLTMTQEGSIADGSLPVALTGRVYALADASYSAIRPGDLLTTSDTKGHIMKVSDYTKAPGTILGKAMSSLEQGQGLVLVLVTLQ